MVPRLGNGSHIHSTNTVWESTLPRQWGCSPDTPQERVSGYRIVTEQRMQQGVTTWCPGQVCHDPVCHIWLWMTCWLQQESGRVGWSKGDDDGEQRQADPLWGNCQTRRDSGLSQGFNSALGKVVWFKRELEYGLNTAWGLPRQEP